MKRFSIGGLVRRGWMLLVAVAVVAIAGFGVDRLHGIFGSHNVTSTGTGIAEDATPFNPKHVVYEVFGNPGTWATVNYFDINAVPQKAERVALPWTYDATTTEPAVVANLVAQGNSGTLGCRIIIDDVVKDERVVTEVNAYTFCLDKSG